MSKHRGQSKDYQLVVGTYTQVHSEAVAPIPFESDGIYRVRFDPFNGDFRQPHLLASLQNPSYLTISADSDYLYAVEEMSAGNIAVFALQSSGETLQANAINGIASHGSYPCYIALSPNGAHLAVANYGSGTLSVIGVDKLGGSLTNTIAVNQHHGSGPNKDRQRGSHMHWANWTEDGNRLYAVDLGADTITLYEQSSNWSKGIEAAAVAPGSGPRHMVFHQQNGKAYVLNELSNTLMAFDVEANGKLTKVQQLSTLPESYQGTSQAGHIALTQDGQYLYVSNRGHDSLVMFQVTDDGLLSKQQTISSAGRWPRHFHISTDQRFLFVANQHSNSIVSFAIGRDGKLTEVGSQLDISQPVLINEISR
ncbi:hypothetical protein GCM10011369_13020 [Neiella marina]|uniref:Lactonase family protein n=1 Tax=Neiella marina TaxID=508461 RepID=A0A8J2U3U7_9GAMM|nr:hypothetical protein GCM10011369_13020 [Neiella marina]